MLCARPAGRKCPPHNLAERTQGAGERIRDSFCRDMRILLVTHYFPAHRGGLEKVAGEMARRLLAAGNCEIAWFASDTDPAPDLPGLRATPVRSWNGFERRFGVPVPLWSPRMIPRLWRAVGTSDVVHIHDTLYPGNILAASFAFMRGKPLVVTQHIGPVAYRNPLLRALVTAGNRLFAANILQRANQVVFISAAVYAYFDARVRWRHPPRLLPNGVDATLFTPPTPEARRAARASLGLSSQPLFLFVGRFVEKKGLPLLRDLARARPDVVWLFAGVGPLDPAAWQLPHVRVFRDRSGASLRELIWASDLLLLPSAPGSEGFPLVVQESLSCGLPALVSADIAAGYPAAGSRLLLEPVGADAESRWLARLGEFTEKNATTVPVAALAEFARAHWSWERNTAEYQRIFMQHMTRV
jgi:glycosyltransferase involved in cell wall biosynthesis